MNKQEMNQTRDPKNKKHKDELARRLEQIKTEINNKTNQITCQDAAIEACWKRISKNFEPKGIHRMFELQEELQKLKDQKTALVQEKVKLKATGRSALPSTST
ncbi:hypothetical protein Droror1_Dr00013902 [Drosera rotundifolia]